MSATSQPTTFSDLYTALQAALKQQTSVTATENIAKRAINTGLIDMHIMSWEKFPWAERHAVLRTQPEYTTGKVSISRGSTSLTGSGTAWNTNNDFSVANARTTGKIVIAGSEEVYTISSVDSDTGITLNEPFIDADVSGESYSYFEDEYALASDFLRPLDERSFADDGKILHISRTEFRRRYVRNKLTGKPIVCAIFERGFSGNTTPIRRAVFHKPPDQAYLIPYSYITGNLVVQADGTAATSLSNDDDEPIVPLQYRHAIVLYALYTLYRDGKDDDRAEKAQAQYNELILRAIGDQEIGSPRPRITPIVSPYARAAKRPLRGRGRRYVTGSAFDEMRG